MKRTLFSGGKEFEEIELDHLDGHKGSRPVRIGNGAIDHVQLVRLPKKRFCRVTKTEVPLKDIYGEL